MLHPVDDLMAIGEFSDRSGLSAKRLRTYAAEGLLAPAAVDPGSGYRYYSPGQLADARLIDALRQAGVPLADIRAFKRSHPKISSMSGRGNSNPMRTTAREPSPSPAISSQVARTHRLRRQPGSKEGLMTTLRTAGRTDVGQLRENNEDVIVTSDRLALVADGMGGHPGGEIAAEVVAGVVPAAFTGQSVDELEAAVRAANWAIRDRAAHPAWPGGHGHHDLCGWTPYNRTRRARQCRGQPGLSIARAR